MITTNSISPLVDALYSHVQATLHLTQVVLTLEWTVFSRLTFSILGLAFIYLLYLIFSLRNARQPLVVWEKLGKPIIKPLRSRVFSFLLGQNDPYAKSIELRVQSLSRGFCTAIMRDHHKNRNPFKSIHATALATFAETVGGLALMTNLKTKDRAILISMNIKYEKKARGLLTATSEYSLPKDLNGKNEIHTEVIVKDRTLDTVALAEFVWMVELV
ncbi:uncharacterized protein BX664DRAFT_340368 [Halteromyces radiatus]|uniref:uncharacterized protein n=1 Tax=Halteromyces radiatus TaxID=101107 RepID=UPI002220EB9F|nr:uncharacterized protein BX664DRAFT_340368 [Halteromyces radiatus]KAI8081426.1 hypothetical protein BX664DRAFT_340368 [Halteromyces radiatus]